MKVLVLKVKLGDRVQHWNAERRLACSTNLVCYIPFRRHSSSVLVTVSKVTSSSDLPYTPRTMGRQFATTMANATTAHPHLPPAEGTFTKWEHASEEILHKVSDKSHIPFWGVLLIVLVIILIILVAFYFCLAKYWKKFQESDRGARFKGLDLKSVNLIGQLGKEKVMNNLC